MKKFLKHLDNDEYLYETDWSSASTHLDCQRKGLFENIVRRRAKERDALLFGSAIHNGLETAYRQAARGEPLHIESCYDVVRATYEASDLEITSFRTLDRALSSIEKYFKHYRHDEFNFIRLPNTDAPLIEASFALPITVIDVNGTVPFYKSMIVEGRPDDHEPFYISKLHVSWIGKLDLGTVLPDGTTRIVDHKTSSIASEPYFSSFQLAQQFIGYCIAIEQLLETEGLPTICEAATGNFIINRKETRTGTSFALERRTYRYSETTKLEWLADIKQLVNNIAQNLKTGTFPGNSGYCNGKYGLCPFFDVCAKPPERRLQLLMSDLFEDNNWDPTKE